MHRDDENGKKPEGALDVFLGALGSFFEDDTRKQPKRRFGAGPKRNCCVSPSVSGVPKAGQRKR